MNTARYLVYKTCANAEVGSDLAGGFTVSISLSDLNRLVFCKGADLYIAGPQPLDSKGQVAPARAANSSACRLARDTKRLSYRGQRLSPSISPAHGDNIIVREDGVRRSFATLCSAVMHLVRSVFGWCAPSKVFQAIVCGVSIQVSRMMAARWSTNKGEKDKAMGGHAADPAISRKAHTHVSALARVRRQNTTPQSRDLAVAMSDGAVHTSDNTGIRHLVVTLVARNAFPARSFDLSHDSLLDRLLWLGPWRLLAQSRGPLGLEDTHEHRCMYGRREARFDPAIYAELTGQPVGAEA